MPCIKFLSRVFLFLSVFLGISEWAAAQEKQPDQIGVLLAGELEYGNFNPTLGFFLEREFTPRSGAEVGLFFRTYHENYYLTIDYEGYVTSENVGISEGYFTIPLLYRFSANFATFSIGPQLDIFSSWSQKNPAFISVDDYDRSPNVRIGSMIKVGKEIQFKESIIFEPELRFGVRSFGSGNLFLGLGLKMKQAIMLRK